MSGLCPVHAAPHAIRRRVAAEADGRFACPFSPRGRRCLREQTGEGAMSSDAPHRIGKTRGHSPLIRAAPPPTFSPSGEKEAHGQSSQLGKVRSRKPRPCLIPPTFHAPQPAPPLQCSGPVVGKGAGPCDLVAAGACGAGWLRRSRVGLRIDARRGLKGSAAGRLIVQGTASQGRCPPAEG